MITIDKTKCVGCGACVALAPQCFELDNNSKAQVKQNCKPNENTALAIENCPVSAISKKS